VVCRRSYPFTEGVFKFETGLASDGEFSPEEMAQLLALANAVGWKSALETYVIPRRPRVVGLLTDPRRVNSVRAVMCGRRERVLDFGCGLGGVSMILAKMFDEVVSLDASENRLAFLDVLRRQEAINNVILVCHTNPASLPFPDEYFDAIVLVGVLEYLPQSLPEHSVMEAHRKCLREFCRVLRPSGRILIHTKNRFGWQYWTGARDHSGLRFAPILPIAVTDLFLRLLRDKRYRIINHSLAGYDRLLRETGFESVKFEWPIPGYQTPDYAINLQANLSGELKKIPYNYFSRSKFIAIRMLGVVGILRYVVPFFSIAAVKSQDAIDRA
jgi:SAM-dependent methyltransferase